MGRDLSSCVLLPESIAGAPSLYNGILSHECIIFSISKLHLSTTSTSKSLQKTGTIVNQVSVVLIVSADACMHGVQGSNPADD